MLGAYYEQFNRVPGRKQKQGVAEVALLNRARTNLVPRLLGKSLGTRLGSNQSCLNVHGLRWLGAPQSNKENSV